jgi:hypothetical protein
MRHPILILLFALASTVCFGQTQIEAQKITKFKRDYLKKAKFNHPDTLSLENLIIVREKYPEFREIKTYEKNKDFVVSEQFYNKTIQLKRIGKYDKIGRPIGIAEHYKKNGELQYVQNYDKGEWIVSDKQSHPYYDLQNTIKAKADSLIIIMYGNIFLHNNCVWIIDGSYISNDKERRTRWTTNLNDEPTKFSFCYKVKFDNQNLYDSYIYFDLDNNGNFVPTFQGGGFFFSGSGFEKVPDSMKGNFRLNYSEALSEAKRIGLIETDSTKAYGQLFWEDFRTLNVFNGQFRFYISIKTKTIENLNPNGRSSKTTKYDVYSFNPWTGKFVEIKKMKTKHWWEKERSGFSLLEPDKE